MNVVLDTNVLMSGIFWSGIPARILELWGHGRFDLLISPQVYGEYREINLRLSEKFGLRSGEKVLQTIFF